MEITETILLAPIAAFGNKYGEKAAIEVVLEARHHCKMDTSASFRQSIENYFGENFGDKSREAIAKELNYSWWAQFVDFLTIEPNNDNHQDPHLGFHVNL